MPKLKVNVESALRQYLTGELTDEVFTETIQAILDEFTGKNLFHQNIGQLTWRMERENPGEKHRFRKIWDLFDQVSPEIRDDLTQRMKKGSRQKGS
ncbi:MAG: hypothetical protein JSV35_06510 [Candidatus Bathyarchaeota archaeon]|nr:MAG: hypothetical protein JSV35_06510 [Candidatus Bathyarchaeota archaeon]